MKGLQRELRVFGAVADARWEFIALIPLFDPPRHDTAETIRQCKEKGIMVKMVTGDQLLIGKETAKQLGMGTTMYTTDTLMHVRAPNTPKALLPPHAPTPTCPLMGTTMYTTVTVRHVRFPKPL
jgi:hypothetical protein